MKIKLKKTRYMLKMAFENYTEILAVYDNLKVEDYDNVYYILVEGNIGVGKTTFCNNLVSYIRERMPNVESIYIPEKINIFLLNSYLKNPRDMALCFQLYMATWRISALREYLRFHQDKPLLVVVDRSIYGDIIFGKANSIYGNITNDNYNLYLHTIIEDCILPKNHQIIYLKANLDVCINRMCKRDRLNEKSDYDTKYLTILNNLHNVYCHMSSALTYDYNLPGDINEIMLAVFTDLMKVFKLQY